MGPRFFLPGSGPEHEVDYDRLRDAVRAETEREPRARRIFSLDCRLDGRDCALEVGATDPVSGEAVLAIFDVGGDEPYSVVTAGSTAMRLRKKTVYSVTEFS